MKKTAKKPARKTNRRQNPSAKTAHRAATRAAAKAAKKSARTSARTPAAPAAIGRKAEVAALMRRPHGVTTAQIKDATGMLEHSARALISGIAKGLPNTEVVAKTKDGSEATVYSIRPAPAK